MLSNEADQTKSKGKIHRNPQIGLDNFIYSLIKMGENLNIKDIELSAISLAGGKSENEDCYLIRETPMGLLVIVCDGLGGPVAGKTASELAAKSIATYIEGAGTDNNPQLALEDAAATANATIRDSAEQNPTLKGMGTTCVCLLLQTDKAYVMNVGDSRCYLLRNDKAIFRTTDHSYVGELVKKGAISEEMARTSEYANVLTRALGVGETFETASYTIEVRPGDRIALMTDGIWGAVPQNRLIKMLCADEELSNLVDRIAYDIDSTARKNGIKHDNLTLVMAELAGRVFSGITYSAISASQDNSGSEDADSDSNSVIYDNTQSEYDDSYELTEESEYEDEEESGSLRKTLIWVFSICLAVALGVILYLTVWSSDKNKKMADNEQTPTQLVDSLKDSAADSTAIQDSVATAPAIAEEVTTTSSEQYYAPSGSYSYNNDYSSYEQTENSADTVIAEPSGPDNSAAINCLNNAITQLESLKDYDPREIPKKDTRMRRKKRSELFDGVVSSLKEGISSTEDASLKSEITQLGQDITAPSTKNNILKIDPETGKSTRASVTAIDGFITKIKSITE